jgi:hypothetical protein
LRTAEAKRQIINAEGIQIEGSARRVVELAEPRTDLGSGSR